MDLLHVVLPLLMAAPFILRLTQANRDLARVRSQFQLSRALAAFGSLQGLSGDVSAAAR